ncbi:MAG: ATP-binding protein [Candidatus Polarisedimenticolaceae bacterium]|nr:ATP-binding protein [Candidatus Polarisedimenticolaceae bacterium]
MAVGTLKRLRRGGWAVALLLLLLLSSLHLMTNAVQNSAELSRYFIPLLIINLVGLVILLLLIGFNLVRLIRQYLKHRAGSRLTVRLVVLFAMISLAPVSIVYYYSQGFLRGGIDSWFDVQIDQAMDDALALSKASLALNQRLLLKYTENLLQDVVDESETALAFTLEELREQSGAVELALLHTSGQVIAYSNVEPTVLAPSQPDRLLLTQLREGSNQVGLVPKGDDELLIRVLVNDPVGRPIILQGLYSTSERIGELSGKLTVAYNRYKELSFLRQSLKANFMLALSLVLLFSLFSAIWVAFFTSRRLVAPITRIAEGTRAIAAGDYSRQLPVPRRQDEIGFLVESFNTMTRRIELAHDETLKSQQLAEGQRAYLETVMGRLSSGLMTFDAELKLRTVNPAAQVILECELDASIDYTLAELKELSPTLLQFIDLLQAPLHSDQEWNQEISLLSSKGRKVLMCHITPFAQPDGQSGLVLLFDEITTLIRAQRDAAWGEVARRLAHEIKNPLTPIQLSAERLRHRYLNKMSAEDSAVLDKATHTIVQQVEAMKEMVNAFSEYARPPKMKVGAIEMDRLISEVLELYYTEGESRWLKTTLTAPGQLIFADPLRLRQVIHNLITNARDAIHDQADGEVRLRSSVLVKGEHHFFEIVVEDNGPGFKEEMLSQIFEPYVTSKTKGTGLGLAIVKKIVEEHNGIIWAENSDNGARMTLQLPIEENRG